MFHVNCVCGNPRIPKDSFCKKCGEIFPARWLKIDSLAAAALATFIATIFATLLGLVIHIGLVIYG